MNWQEKNYTDEFACAYCKGVGRARRHKIRSFQAQGKPLYCSRACAGKVRTGKDNIQVECAGCKKLFTVLRNKFNRYTKQNKKFYCSLACAGSSQKRKQNTLLNLYKRRKNERLPQPPNPNC